MKPVAWMSPDGKFSETEGKLFHIPLYTEPQEYQRPHNTVLVPCDKLKAMQDYIKHLESALESSLNLSKVLVERQLRELTDDEIITRYRELMARSSV